MNNKRLHVVITIIILLLLSFSIFASNKSRCVFYHKHRGNEFVIFYDIMKTNLYNHSISYYYNKELIARIHYKNKTKFYIYDYKKDGTVNNQIFSYGGDVDSKDYSHVLVSTKSNHYFFTYEIPIAFYSDYLSYDSCNIIYPINSYVFNRTAKFNIYQFNKYQIDSTLFFLKNHKDGEELFNFVWRDETNSFLSIAISKIIDREAIRLSHYSNKKLKGRERTEYLIQQTINTVEKQINNYAKRIDKIIIVQKPLIFK